MSFQNLKRPLIDEETIHVYKNLPKDCWSVRSQGRIVAHIYELYLKDALCRVSEVGRQRVLRTGQRHTHAYIKGNVTSEPSKPYRWTRITYDPFNNEKYFVLRSGIQVDGAGFVHFTHREIFATLLRSFKVF